MGNRPPPTGVHPPALPGPAQNHRGSLGKADRKERLMGPAEVANRVCVTCGDKIHMVHSLNSNQDGGEEGVVTALDRGLHLDSTVSWIFQMESSAFISGLILRQVASLAVVP